MSEANTPDAGTGPMTPGQGAAALSNLLTEDEAPLEETASEEAEDSLDEEAPEYGDDPDGEEAEDQDEAETETEAPTPKAREITLPDGTKVTVTPDELEKGYLRQADYTRKTQQLAEQARKIESSNQQELARLQDALQRVEQAFPDDPEPEYSPDDPFGYQERHAEWSKRNKAREQAHRELAQAAQKQQHQWLTQVYEHNTKQSEVVRSHPLFSDVVKDAKKAQERTAAIRQTALDAGFSAEDFDNIAGNNPQGVSDARAFIVLEKARRYDELMSKSKQVEANSSPAPKERRPGRGAKPTQKQVADSKLLGELRRNPKNRRAAAQMLGAIEVS